MKNLGEYHRRNTKIPSMPPPDLLPQNNKKFFILETEAFEIFETLPNHKRNIYLKNKNKLQLT